MVRMAPGQSSSYIADMVAGESNTPRRRRRFVRALGIVAALIALAAVLGIVTARNAVMKFTASAPAQLPTTGLSADEVEALEDRIYAFQQALRQQLPAEPLTLNAEEINALLATHPAARHYRDKVHVVLDGDEAKAYLSMPLKDLGTPFLEGRYFNGVVTFRIDLQSNALGGNTLIVAPEELSSKGKPVPGFLQDRIRRYNLAERINADPRASLALEWLRKIEVKDGKVVITPTCER